MRRIKILYICTALNRGWGGEKRVLALARHINRSRFDFAICVIETASPSSMSELAAASCPLYSLNLSRRLHNPVGLARIVYRLHRLVADIRPDIVQTHALHANLLARPAAIWAGVPVIISTENSLPDSERNPLRRAFNAPLYGLNRLLDRSTHRIVVVSEWVRRWKDPKGRSQKIRVIPPSFRLEAFYSIETNRPAAPRPSQAGAPVLGVVGRLSAEKGHRFLIAAMPEILDQCPEAQLLIVGSGPLEAKLRTQVEALALTKSVHFLGYVSDVHTVYARMDILVVPSLSEAFSLVTVEGMMMELPVVGARTGEIAEIVLDGETGLLVPPADRDAIARACRYLLSNPDVGRNMGKRGRERVLDRYRPLQFIARHEDLYASAFAAAPGSDRAAS